MTLLVIGLSFKILIIDAYVKNEIQSKNSCSLFLSTFVPDFFVALAYACLMIKSLLLLINFNENKQSYQEKQKKRVKYSNIGLFVYMIILLIMMFLRCCNTCQRDRVLKSIEEALPFLSSRTLVSILVFLKTIPVVIIAIAFVMLMLKEYFKSKILVLGLAVMQILLYTGFNIFNIYRLEQKDTGYYVMNARYQDYISIFFVDIVLIAVFMFILLVLRQGELHILV